ncbi:class I SAM-dependent methyltransferase [Spirillospora sp. NPDC047279]|uniref:class I SAM-dependent methyltransferase n=1 Tax=Spirillospora sp. NPDC047279 TaxID=3155478 RepID=UPI0033FB7BF5
MANPEDVKAAIAEIFDRSAATYEQVGPEFFAPIGAELARRAAPRPGERVLDVGCGRGHSLLPAAEAVGTGGAAVGIDLAPGMVAGTAAEAERRGLSQVSVLVGDATAPDVAPGSFDVVIAGLVIFFLPDPDAALRAWAKALGPGGRLALTTFGAQDPRHAQAMKTIVGFLPDAGTPTRRAAEALRDTEAVHRALLANGFTGIAHAEVTFETRFDGPGQWWEWVWSHGGRDVVERLPADRVDAAREAACTVMEDARTPGGDLAIQTIVRYSTAVPVQESAVPG